MIRLIALDLDDTLLMPDCTVPEDTLDVLRKADERGARIVIATGRIFPSAKMYAELLGTDCPVICYNGAMIRSAGGETLYSEMLHPDILRRMAVFCRERGLYLQLYDEDDIVVEEICEATLIDPDAKVTKIREAGDLTRAELHPSPKMMILDDPERIPEIRSEAQVLFGEELYLAQSKDYLLEMMPAGVSKRETLRRFAESLGIRREEVMACGDNTNDLEMVEWAGLGVAVANAVPELKAKADYAAESERSEGVAEAVRKFVLI